MPGEPSYRSVTAKSRDEVLVLRDYTISTSGAFLIFRKRWHSRSNVGCCSSQIVKLVFDRDRRRRKTNIPVLEQKGRCTEIDHFVPRGCDWCLRLWFLLGRNMMELMFQIVICKRRQYEGAELIPAGEGARGPDCYSEIQVRNPWSFFLSYWSYKIG